MADAETTEAGTTAITPEDGETGGTVWDAPNQQVVRADNAPPWEEGTGGEAGEATPHTAEHETHGRRHSRKAEEASE